MSKELAEPLALKETGSDLSSVFISVVAPVYNEEAGIADFIEELVGALNPHFTDYEIILVDDGSSDRSTEIIRRIAQSHAAIRLLELSRNYGREIALTAGLDNAIGDFVVVMDSDGQDPPDLIPKMVAKALEGYDVVYGERATRDGETFLKKFTSKLFYRVARRVSGLDIPDNAGDFRVFSRKVVNSLGSMKEQNRYMKMLYAYVGFRSAGLPFDRRARSKGATKYNYYRLVLAAMDAIFGFSVAPLRLMAFASVCMSLLAFLVSVLAVLIRLTNGESTADGWASLEVTITGMFAALFLFLAILAEYVSRTLIESKNRPLYFVREEVGSSTSVRKIVDIAHGDTHP